MSLLPEAPRNPRWRAALRAWWPLGLFAVLLFVALTVTGAILWILSGGGTPFRDWALDSGTDRAEAQVTRVRTTAMRVENTGLEAVSYVFDLGNGIRRFGVSYAFPGRFRAGTRADVEFLPADPDVHRLVGAKSSATSYWLTWYLGWLWLPSLVLLLYWFRRVWRLKVVLRNGPSAAARIESARPVAAVLPPQVRVRFRFVDRSGQGVESSHWVGRSSPMGRRLDAPEPEMEVVYDELQPRFARLAGPEDFLSP